MRASEQTMCDMRRLGSIIVKFKTNMETALDVEVDIEETWYLGDETDDNYTSESISLSARESGIDERKECFRQTNITTTSFRAVLERLAEPDFNFIKEEQITAAAVLGLLNLGDSHLQQFEKLLDSVARLFEKCFVALKSPRKQANVRAQNSE